MLNQGVILNAMKDPPDKDRRGYPAQLYDMPNQGCHPECNEGSAWQPQQGHAAQLYDMPNQGCHPE